MMRPGKLLRALAVMSVLALPAGSALAAGGTIDVRSLLKAFGILYVVDRFSPELNDLINQLTFRHHVRDQMATKVVPIVSVGSGAYVGAAQVSGPADRLARVQAVGQLEGTFLEGDVRAKALVPLDSKNPLQGLRRVPGVGVTAVIDLLVESPAPAPQPAPKPAPQPQPAPSPQPAPAPIPAPVPVPPRPAPAPIPAPSPAMPNAFRYLIFAEEDAEISGNSHFFAGNLRANDDLKLSGNQHQVTGWLEAGDEVDVDDRGRGRGHGRGRPDDDRVREGVDKLVLPDFASRPWRERASRIYEGDLTLGAYQVRGIIYVDGDLKVRGPLSGSGVLVVNGQVELETSQIMGPDLLVWARKDVKLEAHNARVRAGLVSTDGKIEVKGNHVSLRGFLAGRKVEIKGNDGEWTYDDAPLTQWR